ncbi:hypothetical protein QFC22_006617 [Naganishia vaughanmartiniae]|uniref:Uncharacterized protein n=1 Tax=Naganishia vaughanmartiniae TaxID=1424756 RepID=A0ACC2WHZ3_9TREE|nr:hypothetical protein QFC22_006617 [Naganishia vaughanmartiniae]
MADESAFELLSDDLELALSAKYPTGLPQWASTFVTAASDLEKSEKMKKERLAKARDGPRYYLYGSKSEELKKLEAGLEESKANLEAHYHGQGEAGFIKAVLEAKGKEPILWEWLTFRRISEEKWSEARIAALAAVQLDPLCVTLLYRLSTCYEQERDYVHAYDYFRRATSLLPIDQRAEHKAKFLRLKEQSDDIKSNIIRRDPLEALPLEIVIAICKIGLEGDRNFVLKATWVNGHWRDVLNHHCPELWGTMVFKTNEVKDHSFDDKRAAWIARSSGKFHIIIFESMMKSYADKVPKACFPLFKHVKKLDVNAGHGGEVLERILYKFKHSCDELEDLRILGGWFPGEASYIRSERGHVPAPYPDLHCGFVNGTATKNIRKMDLECINFHIDGYLTPYTRTPIVVDRITDSYPALKRLSVVDCKLDETKVVDVTAAGEGVLKPRKDALHRALRGAPNLEYLKVSDDKQQEALFPFGAPSVAGESIPMPHLRKAIIPPPSAKYIDIESSELTVLSFETEFGSRYARRPLVPMIEASPIGQGGTAALARLKYVGFHCSASDDIDRFNEWLPYLKGVRVLVIRGAELAMSNGGNTPPTAREPGKIQLAQLHIVQTLVDNPEWCPRLKHLQLSFCYIPEKQLAMYIRQRGESSDCTSLGQLTLHRCSTLTDSSRASFQKQLGQFRELGGYPIDNLRYVDGCEDTWDEEL